MIRIITEKEKKDLRKELKTRLHNMREYVYNTGFIDPKIFPVLKSIKYQELIIDAETIDILMTTDRHQDFVDRYYDIFKMLRDLLESDNPDHHQMAFDLIIEKIDFLIGCVNFGDFNDSTIRYKDKSEIKSKAKEYLYKKLNLDEDVTHDLRDSVKLLIQLY
jgi:hypothetical protein